MGLTVGLSVVLGIIDQLYYIDRKINALYQRKFQLSNSSNLVGRTQAAAVRMRPSADIITKYGAGALSEQNSTLMRVHVPMMGADGTNPVWDGFEFTNSGGQASVNPFTGNVPPVQMAPGDVIVNWDGSRVADGAVAQDGNGNDLEAGERYETKEQIEAEFKQYLTEITAMEKEIDMELEKLKALREALQKQREEFTKYTQKAIETTFTNKYA